MSDLKSRITIRGDGLVSAFPDLLVVRLGVVSEGESLSQLQFENAAIIEDIIQTLEELGVEEIITFTYSIDKNYIFDNGSRIDGGYIIRNILEIRTFDLDNIGTIIDAATASGANQVDLVTFQIFDSSKYYQEALNLAIIDGIDKARNISEAFELDINLSPASITEHNTIQSSPMPFNLARESMTTTPILPGDQDIIASVTMEFIKS